jgi:hypothetical protein
VVSWQVATSHTQRQALKKYLDAQGYVCVGKFNWPIDVSSEDFQHNARDAVQMPVLDCTS